MYTGHTHLCPSLAAFPRYCTDPDVTWGNGRGYPLVVHYWADLQSVHELCHYDNKKAPNAEPASACTRSMAGFQWLWPPINYNACL